MTTKNQAITYMTGYSDGKEWAQTSQAVVEPVYQYQLANGNWIDQTKESYDYNVKHGQATVRMLYATPQAAAQPPAPSDAAREYMAGYSDGREWTGATNQAQQAQSVPEPVLQWCGEGTVQGLCRGKLDDCKFKQAQPEAGVQSILDEMAEDEQLLMDRDMGDS